MFHRFILTKRVYYFWVFLYTFKARVFWAAGVVAKIGSCLKPNQHKQIWLSKLVIQIYERLWSMRRISSKQLNLLFYSVKCVCVCMCVCACVCACVCVCVCAREFAYSHTMLAGHHHWNWGLSNERRNEDFFLLNRNILRTNLKKWGRCRSIEDQVLLLTKTSNIHII